jgi:hypothetical protein
MELILAFLAGAVVGSLCGFDRLIFKGKLRQLYSPDGMHCLFSANHVLRKDFKSYTASTTENVLAASLQEEATKLRCFRYLGSVNTDKDAVARAIADERAVREGLVCVLKCVEPCWKFVLNSTDNWLVIQGTEGRCAHLYHYFLHPVFGWCYVRLQTWFPFEVQIYINGREWLCRQMDQAGLNYTRSDNKILHVDDWQKAQSLLDSQRQIDWVPVLNAMMQQVHPLHPRHLGNLPLDYSWTNTQCEWASDFVFADADDLNPRMQTWLQHGMSNFDGLDVMRFLNLNPRTGEIRTELRDVGAGLRLKHWIDKNSLKIYNHANVMRVESTINNPAVFKSYRAKETDPEGPKDWRMMRRGVADMAARAEAGQAANERYVQALIAVESKVTLKELAEPLCQRVQEPGDPSRHVRALNPLSAQDAQLLQIVSDPKWCLSGLRNRDILARLYPEPTNDAREQQRRSARVTRLIRLLRGHGILEKIPRSHRYQISEKKRANVQAVLLARDLSPDKLTAYKNVAAREELR